MVLHTILRQNSEITYSERVAGGKMEPRLHRNGFIEGKQCKINRIPLQGTAIVNVLSVYSPSLIWVRITNHVADTLVVREPAVLNPLPESECVVWNYCMAPVEDRVFGRARILHVVVYEQRVQLLFIDEGRIAWAKRDSLASIHSPSCMTSKLCPKPDFVYHPWQAIAVSLADIGSVEGFWSAKVCGELRNTVADFDSLKIQTVLSSEASNDHGKTVPVRMYGLTRNDRDAEKESDSISSMLLNSFSTSLGDGEVVAVKLEDGKEHECWEKEEPDEQSTEVDEIRSKWPDNWKKESEEGHEVVKDWVRSFRNLQVPPLTVRYLHEQGFIHEGGVFVSVEGQHTVSPYEFYARPIKLFRPRDEIPAAREGGGDIQCVGDMAAILDANEELNIAGDILDTFYSVEKNRRNINDIEMKQALEDGVRVFVVCQAPPERAAYTGSWQRVEVLGSDTFAHVRFLDSGGTDILMHNSLFMMHPDHAEKPAMCGQFCVHGLKPFSAADDWTKVRRMADRNPSVNRFRSLLREDLAAQMEILGPGPERKGEENDGETTMNEREWKEERPAFQRADVLFVKSLKVYEEDESIMETMMKEGMAASDPLNPVPLQDIRVSRF